MTRTQRVALAVVHRLHPLLIRDTERIILNVALALVGLSSLLILRDTGTLSAVLPIPLLVEWGVTLTLGGTLALVGMFRSQRLLERAGMALSALGCVTYAGVLIHIGGPRQWLIAIVFVGIALTKVIRLLVSTAAQAIVSPTTPSSVQNGAEERP